MKFSFTSLAILGLATQTVVGDWFGKAGKSNQRTPHPRIVLRLLLHIAQSCGRYCAPCSGAESAAWQARLNPDINLSLTDTRPCSIQQMA